MRGENAGVLSAMSDVSASCDSEDEVMHVMDPSDPRAHRPAPSVTPFLGRHQGTNQKSGITVDSDSDTGDDASRSVTCAHVSDSLIKSTTDGITNDDAITIDDDEHDGFSFSSKEEKRRKRVTLSKWAQTRFLVPAGARKVAVAEDTCLEPLNDFILSDFSSRFRGTAGNVDVEKAIATAGEEGAAEGELLLGQKHVGAPLFETSTGRQMMERSRKDEGTGNNQKMPKKEGDGRKRKESRYFLTDLATKCYHCGEVGHMASVCMNDKLQPPCYYCALRGHQSWACPNLPCANCLQLGHQDKNCNNRALTIKPCRICGCTGHVEDNCGNVNNLEQVTCMVCTQVGHLHCVPVPPPADRRVYCPNCAENHTMERCRRYNKSAPVNLTARIASGRFVQTCFVCSEAGHIAAECPTRSNGYGRSRDGCYKCGRSGHFAADCYNSSNHDSYSRRDTGRKRHRDVGDENPNYKSHRVRRS
uniref:CCHC-type domain-containing protein n=1 Tax=Peronospora matthiolae TaxID=2874970 RepID=A0AAV1UBY6_9STRA